MAYFYSKLANGFFTDDLHDTMPSDAVAVTDDVYQAMLAGQAAGQMIVGDASGNPQLVAQAVATPSVAQQIASLQAQQTPDLFRACLLGDAASLATLKTLDAQIVTLRSQLPRP